jgi:hypothetical protein
VIHFYIMSIRNQVQHCSVCGEAGHKKSFHTERTEKTCGECKNTFPLENFRTKKSTNGLTRSPYFSWLCIDCDKAKSAARYRSSPKNRMSYLLNSAKSRCRASNIPFDISIDYLTDIFTAQDGLCYYTKQLMTLETGRNGISLERKEPSLGYIKNNVVLTTWIINNMKRDLTEKEFVEMCKLVIHQSK